MIRLDLGGNTCKCVTQLVSLAGFEETNPIFLLPKVNQVIGFQARSTTNRRMTKERPAYARLPERPCF